MTQQNLYKPPAATTVDFESQGRARSARPISAWILLALLAVIVVLLAIGVGRGAWIAVTASQRIWSPLGLAGFAIGEVVAIAPFVAVILGIHRGRPWSRWVGLGLIVLFGIWCVAVPDHTSYRNDAEASGGMLAKYLLFPALALWWAAAFAFTDKAKRYFAAPSRDAA